MRSNTRANTRVSFDVLDFYRFAGAFVVAIEHFTVVYLPVSATVRTRMELLQPLMGFFFALSGFVIMHVYDRRMNSVADYFDYLQKRLARIYPLHIAALALAVLWGVLAKHDYWFVPDAIIPNILLLHAWSTTDQLTFDYPSWSVSAEFFVYLLFPVFLIAINRAGLWGALLLSTLSIVPIAWVFHVCDLGPWTLATYDLGCLRAVPSFLAGMAVYRLAMERFSTLVVPGWAAHGVAMATVPMMLLGVPNVLMLGVFAGVVFLLARAEPKRPGLFSTPPFRALADCSYGFYMLHAFVGVTMLQIVPKIFQLGDGWLFALVAPALVMTAVLSVLSFRYFEAPARRYFSALPLRPRLHWVQETRNIRVGTIESVLVGLDPQPTQDESLPHRGEWVYRRLGGVRTDPSRP
jgi:peptidoglycan/LPS O-acetylase OafA/YrhL